MTVVWLPGAEQDRFDILTTIALENPAAARRMNARFDHAATSLKMFPNRGRPGLIPGTREIFPHPSYRLVYVVENRDVYILALAHAAMQWPPAPN